MAYANTTKGFWNWFKDGDNPNPNVLHNYENVTYDITLAMTTTNVTKNWLSLERSTEKLTANINDLNNKSVFTDDMIILAQTAGTVAQITRLDMEAYASPNQVSSLTFSTKMRMAITQPLGSNLVQNIYKAASILDIENHYSHPYFLQVYLKGRSKDGSIPEQEIPGTKRVYAININRMTYRIDNGATIYDVEAIRSSDTAKSDDHNLIQDLSISEQINSFDEFLQAFKKKVNEQEKHYLGQTKLILDQYEFKVRGPWKGGDSQETDDSKAQEFLASPIQDDINAMNLQNQGTDEGAVKIEIEKNTSIREVLETFCARNVYAQQQIRGAINSITDSFTSDKWEDIKLTKMLPMIACHHEIIKYDPLRNDYARKFVWTISLQDMVTINAAVRDEIEPNEEYSKKRTDYMMQSKTIVKRYDYYNTGMNIDVTNFDINFNFQYVFGLDTVVGLYNRYGSAMNSSIQQDSDNIDHNKAIKAQNAANLAHASGGNAGSSNYDTLVLRYDTLKKVRQSYMDLGVEPDANSLETYNTLAEQFNKDAEKYDRSISPGSPAKGTLGELTAIDSNDINFEKESSVAGFGKNDRFNIHSDPESTLAEKISDARYKEGIKKYGTKFPTQFYERYIQPSNEGMFEVGAGSEFNTVITNAKTGSNEMIRAELDIIGDPYWLDKPEFSADFSSTEAVNFKRENVILFTSRYPSETLKEAASGSEIQTSAEKLKMNTDQFLTAIYRVVRVDNTFDNGQFMTRLSMVRDSITDLGLVLQEPYSSYDKKEDAAANVTSNNQSMKDKVEKIDTDNSGEQNDQLPVPKITVEFAGNPEIANKIGASDVNFDVTNPIGDKNVLENTNYEKYLKASGVGETVVGKANSLTKDPNSWQIKEKKNKVAKELKEKLSLPYNDGGAY